MNIFTAIAEIYRANRDVSRFRKKEDIRFRARQRQLHNESIVISGLREEFEGIIRMIDSSERRILFVPVTVDPEVLRFVDIAAESLPIEIARGAKPNEINVSRIDDFID